MAWSELTGPPVEVVTAGLGVWVSDERKTDVCDLRVSWFQVVGFWRHGNGTWTQTGMVWGQLELTPME